MQNKENKETKKRAMWMAIVFLIGLVGLLGYHCIDANQRSTDKDLIIEALNSDMKKTVDKYGAEITEKKLIMSSYKELKKLHVSDSSEIGKLKALVKKNTISATRIANTTSGTAVGFTDLVFIHDTIPQDTIYPIYKTKIQDKWTDISVTATKDSTKVDYKLFNEFEITQEYVKEGRWPLRREVPQIKVRNLNPHTETTQVASYAVKPPKTGKKTAFAVGAGTVIGIILTLFLVK